jgi:3-dehydrosphinganine reductase
MLLHDINIHIFMPAGIDTPGYVTENKEKPKVTLKIEEGDKVISPTECAGHLIRGTSGRTRKNGRG